MKIYKSGSPNIWKYIRADLQNYLSNFLGAKLIYKYKTPTAVTSTCLSLFGEDL